MSGVGFFSGGAVPVAGDFAFSATLLGTGNLCVVLRARHRASDRVFAVKRFSKAAIARAAKRAPNTHADIINEKNIASRVSTLAGATLHATFQDGANISFVYDWCDGGELWSAATEAPFAGGGMALAALTPAEPRYASPLPADACRSIIAWLARSLVALSGAGVAHRDIKPENILLRSPPGALPNSLDDPRADGLPNRPFTLALVDWGSARDVINGPGVGSECVGSFEYMAPEAFDNAGAGGGVRVDARADLWALGVVAVRLATGVGAWSADSPFLSGTRAAAHQADEGDGTGNVGFSEVDGLLLAPNTPVEMESFARALLQRNPEKRLGAVIGTSDQLTRHPYICDAMSTETGAFVPDLAFTALRAAAAMLALAPPLSVADLRRAFSLRDGNALAITDDCAAPAPAVVAWAVASRTLRSARPGLQAAVLHALALRRRAAPPHIWAAFAPSLGAARACAALSAEPLAGLRRIGGLSPRELLGWAAAPDTLVHDKVEAEALGLAAGAGEKANDWGWLRARGHAWASSLHIVFVADARLGSGPAAASRLARVISAVNALSPPPRVLVFVGDTFGGAGAWADAGGEAAYAMAMTDALDVLISE